MSIKKLFIISFIIAVVAILAFMFFILSREQPPTTAPQTPPPSPFPTQGNLKGPIRLTSSTPVSGSTNVPITTKPSFTFNTSSFAGTPNISVVPNIPFTFSQVENVITINPQQNLAQSTNYTFSITIDDQVFFNTFTTTGVQPTLGADTRPVDIYEEQQEELKNIRPDVYLSNYTPFANSSISVTTRFVTTPTGHFQFVVKSLSATNPQQSFSEFAQTSGLNDSQTASLDVVYE